MEAVFFFFWKTISVNKKKNIRAVQYSSRPPVQWVTGSFPGVKSGRGVTLTPHPLPAPWSWKSRAIPLLPLRAVRPVQSLSVCNKRCTLPFSSTACRHGRRLHRIQVPRPNLGPQTGCHKRWLLIYSYTSGKLYSNISKHAANLLTSKIFSQFIIYIAVRCCITFATEKKHWQPRHQLTKWRRVLDKLTIMHVVKKTRAF
jgi:hypothetical protein